VLELEERVWKNIGIPRISPDVFRRWTATYQRGFFVAVLEGKVCGYTYHERINFDAANPIASIQPLIHAGYTGRTHTPSGNALYGISVVAHPPNLGAGKALLNEAIKLAHREGVAYIVTFSRMPGLAGFLQTAHGLPAGAKYCTEELALHYAIQSMNLVDGLIDASLSEGVLPDLPAVTQSDPVLGRFAKLMGMKLYGVVPSTFPDPKSANMAALAAYAIPQI